MGCRLVGRDSKWKREGVRDDLSASRPLLEAKKKLFRVTVGVRGWRRKSGKEVVVHRSEEGAPECKL